MESGSSPEPRLSSESSSSLLDRLSKDLGFVENDELKSIKQQIYEAQEANDREAIRSAIYEYQIKGEDAVSKLDGSDYTRGQIGLILSLAAMHKGVGNTEVFLNAVEDAIEYAFDLYDDGLVSTLENVQNMEFDQYESMDDEE